MKHMSTDYPLNESITDGSPFIRNLNKTRNERRIERKEARKAAKRNAR